MRYKNIFTDSGIGIHHRDHKKRFERFYHADQISERFSGCRSWPVVCKQILKEHKGLLWVESEETGDLYLISHYPSINPFHEP